MKRQKGVGLTMSRRVTRSTTTLDRNSLTLPVEVVTEIFSRLPLKSIAICRCVCKLWSSVLRSQDFTDSFFTKSCARPQLLFVCESHSGIHFMSPQPENPEDNSRVVATYNIARSPSYSKLYGCTNGFFCYGAEQGRNAPVLVTVICNPSTRQSLTLPGLSSTWNYEVKSYLGYDPIAKQFKVLSLCDCDDGSKEFHVLTLGTKKLSWRVAECCVPHRCSSKWICISGALYYAARPAGSSVNSIVVCFDLRSETFSSVEFGKAMPGSTTLVNYGGKLGLLMSGDSISHDVTRASTSFELWVLLDAAKHEWSKHVYVLPPSWEGVVAKKIMRIAGMVGTNEIVLSPRYQNLPYYVIYFNVESKTIRKVGIQGLEAFQDEIFQTYLNYVQNVKLL